MTVVSDVLPVVAREIKSSFSIACSNIREMTNDRLFTWRSTGHGQSRKMVDTDGGGGSYVEGFDSRVEGDVKANVTGLLDLF